MARATSKTQQANTPKPKTQRPASSPASETPDADWDSPWKELLTLLIQAFLRFFHLPLYEMIDWSRGYEFLDKELQKLMRDAKTGRRYVDKLLKVYLKGGAEVWILIHIEIQAEVEADFPHRMFIYHIRLTDKHGRPVLSLAVLTDSNPNWRPTSYEQELLDTKIRLDFPIVKLLDYRERWEELEASDNPFALVVMAHLKAMETVDKVEERYRWKWELIQRLHRQGYSRQEVLELYRILDWLMAMPAEVERRFDAELAAWEEEQRMPYLMGIERRAIAKGIDQGIDQGKQEVLLEQLRAKFSELPDEIEKQVQKLDTAALKQLSLRILTAQTLAEVGLGNGNGASSNA